MDVLGGPALILDAADCAVLGPHLVQAIRLAYVGRGTSAPRALVRFSEQVNRMARGSAGLSGNA